jgi:hypothetical protein
LYVPKGAKEHGQEHYKKEAHLLSKKAVAMKLLTNRKVRQGAVELLKDPDVRATLLQQTAQRLRRP